jgi:hypothetical protein
MLVLLKHLMHYIRENLTTNTASLRENGRKQHPDAPIYSNPIIQYINQAIISRSNLDESRPVGFKAFVRVPLS